MYSGLMVRRSSPCWAVLLVTACAAGDEGSGDAGGGGLDGGRVDGGRLDAGALDAGPAPDAGPTDGGATDGGATDGGVVPVDAGSDGGPIGSDAGCTPGASRACTITCTGGTTAMGRETCLDGILWSACERRPEMCGNGLDDDGDGMVDEDCRVEGACIWVRPQCQSVMTLNEVCAAAGGRRLVAGRRCPVAGAAVVALDATYGTYPLCCCNVASMCVPECSDPSCSSCVVWDEIQCCP
jgi:hypothetical protein